jgi:hypothetical protein
MTTMIARVKNGRIDVPASPITVAEFEQMRLMFNVSRK